MIEPPIDPLPIARLRPATRRLILAFGIAPPLTVLLIILTGGVVSGQAFTADFWSVLAVVFPILALATSTLAALVAVPTYILLSRLFRPTALSCTIAAAMLPALPTVVFGLVFGFGPLLSDDPAAFPDGVSLLNAMTATGNMALAGGLCGFIFWLVGFAGTKPETSKAP